MTMQDTLANGSVSQPKSIYIVLKSCHNFQAKQQFAFYEYTLKRADSGKQQLISFQLLQCSEDKIPNGATKLINAVLGL